MAPFLLTHMLVLISAQLVKSSGVFELKVHSFTTTSSSSSVCKESRDCQVFFRVCLNYTQDVMSYRLACSNGTGLTGTFSTDQSSISTSAPITVPFKLKGLGTFSVIVEAWSTESSNDPSMENLNSMINHFATQINLTIGEKWSQDVHLGEQSKLHFSYRAVCDEFYYGDDCTDFCRPRDDPFGHFNCDAAGNRICLPKWKGHYCAEPVCLPGCNEIQGYCEAPGECRCRYGWQGPRCDECLPYPGCRHGTCRKPQQCTCDEGWFGLLCDKNYKDE
ncbi:delta-like protein C [Pseudorasbora parva]|uniref:delta-like protein C n=1 Tax=Pseudorasbora parva TaxID=51549 RepID=UPI00351E3685